jgi:hypothetical protein
VVTAVAAVKDFPPGIIRSLLDLAPDLAERLDSAGADETVLLGEARVRQISVGSVLVDRYTCRPLSLAQLAEYVRASLPSRAERLERETAELAEHERQVAIRTAQEREAKRVEAERRQHEEEADEQRRLRDVPGWREKRAREATDRRLAQLESKLGNETE